MEIEESDSPLLEQLGNRLRQYRLNQNMTQSALAQEAGVSVRTINRLEHGQSTQLFNLIRLLRSLGLVENLNLLIPRPAPSPIQQMKLRGKNRKRASTSRIEEKREVWSWGQDE